MKIAVEPGFEINCEVDDYLWPWTEATPVLLHHGFSRNATFWRGWIPLLTGSRRVYRPEMRGCGKSDVPRQGDPLTPEVLASDLIRTMDTLGLERVHWVGESSGGVLGMYFAANYPERIASLVLINTPVRVQRNASARILEGGVAAWSRATLGDRIDLDYAPPELQDFYITEMDKTENYVAAAIMDCVETIVPTTFTKKITAPVLLLGGDKRKKTMEENAVLRAELPNVREVVVRDYGKAIHVLAPERCASEALGFWEALEKSPVATSR